MDVSDNIFFEFDDQSEELHRLLAALKERLPDGRFHIVSEQGKNISLEEPLSLPGKIRKSLIGKAKKVNSLVQDELTGGISAYATPVNELNAVLVFMLPDQLSDPATKYYGTAIVQLCIDLFLSQKAVRNEQEFSITQKKQLDRKIHVLEEQYQEILEENQKEYRRIIDSIEEGYCEVDLAGNLTFVNNALVKMFGYTRDELTAMNNRDYMNQEDSKRIFKAYNTAYKTGKAVKGIGFAVKTNDGAERYLEASVSLMKDGEGQPVGFRGVVRDITERKRAEEALRKSEQHFRLLFNLSPVGIFHYDTQLIITGCNNRFAAILQSSKEKLVGLDMKTLNDQGIVPSIARTLEGKEGFFEGFYRATTSPARIWATMHNAPLFDENGEVTGGVGIVEDITERKRAEEELKNTNEQLEEAIARSNEMAVQAEIANMAKSQFLANMSHEIRTPMNAVLGFADMILDSDLDEDQTDYVSTIKRSGESLLSLINDILDFSKIEAGQLGFEEIDFDPELIAYDVCESIRPKIVSKPIEILCHIGNNLPSLVKGDPGRYRQVITNLMGNAPKFTESGEIELSIDVEEENETRVKLHAKIRDTGIGIPEDKLSLIFQPFQQVDSSTTRKYGGTGLGLSICKQISKLMNGNVWAESEGEGKGSTFHFTAWLGKAEGRKTKKMKSVSLSDKRALIVDDNRANLDILKHFLESSGMRVAVLTKGKDVIPTLQKALKTGNPFDLCISDIQMPDMSGYEVAKEIRNSKLKIKTLPLIALSSMMRGDAVKCKEAGFDGFLSKPVHREKLFQMLERILSDEDGTTQIPKSKNKDSIVTQYTIREEMKHSISILLAEDNLVNQKLAKLMLTKAGYRVEVANNGKEAVEKYTASPGDFDLIFMDIQMPEMDGMQATQEIRNRESQTKNKKDDKLKIKNSKLRVPIVAMTAHAMQGDREKCLEAGMDDYISKPIKRELVFKVIEKWVLGA
ncbi:MAG: response regulator [Syntrophobacterales bacterium]|nr:response regulator [Syntrophobacterales bacterium]